MVENSLPEEQRTDWKIQTVTEEIMDRIGEVTESEWETRDKDQDPDFEELSDEDQWNCYKVMDDDDKMDLIERLTESYFEENPMNQ